MNYNKISGYHVSSTKRLRSIEKHKIITSDQTSKILRCISKIPKKGDPNFTINISETDPIIIFLKNHPVITSLEISLEIKGKVDNEKPIKYEKYDILIRLYSDKEKFRYRERYDSQDVKDKFSGSNLKRLMAQYHFDRKKEGCDNAFEPFFHLHFGGKHTPDELCWYPSEIDDPRIPYPPMDIMLLIEFIFHNYFLRETNEFRETPEWKQMIRQSQEIFQRHYFEKCIEFLDAESTLLECSCKYPKKS